MKLSKMYELFEFLGLAHENQYINSGVNKRMITFIYMIH